MVNPNKPPKASSHGVFSSVDELVSKPVLGSDGAASWQAFQNETKKTVRPSAAPRAPLKKADKLGTGLTTWDDEKAHEDQVRKDAGHASANEGYTVFKKKGSDEEAVERKKRAAVEAKIRPDDSEYFLPSKTFEGWKFDYVFTTRTYGTGYYWDGSDSVKELNGELKRDGDADRKDRHNNADEKNGEEGRPKKKKKRKVVKGPVIVSDPNNPMEQVHAMLQKRNQQQQMMWAGSSALGETPLPLGWEAAKDPFSGKTYYFHRPTGERKWEKPAEEPVKPKPDEEDMPIGWESAKDKDGKTYYFHRGAGKASWEKPTKKE